MPEPWLGRLIEVKAALRPAGWHDTMDPHVTLLAPDRPLAPADHASNAFASVPLGAQTFRLRAHRLHRFSRRHLHTVVLQPDDPGPLNALFESLVAGSTWQATDASSKRPYEPHITLANQVTSQRLELIQATLAAHDLNVAFDCQEIALYAKQARWPRWQELCRRPLTLGEK